MCVEEWTNLPFAFSYISILFVIFKVSDTEGVVWIPAKFDFKGGTAPSECLSFDLDSEIGV